MKWGLFGGTFDPIHTGHLRCASEMLEICGLNRILFVPAARPPHKPNAEITPFRHRERMIRLAIEGNPAFSFSDVENQRENSSYSIDTVEHILHRRRSKGFELHFICGQDAFHEIRTWKDWERLLLMCHFAVMTRPGYGCRKLDEILGAEFASRFTHDAETGRFCGPTGRRISFCEVTFLDISSSNIRERVRNGRDIRYLVPDEVRRYIARHSLYKYRNRNGLSLP